MRTFKYLILLSFVSFNVLSIENGISVNWNKNNDFLKLYSLDDMESCSGTLIAGKYVLSAAHCFKNRYPIEKVATSNGLRINIINQNTHPDYYDNTNGGSGNWHDVAVSELNNHVDTSQIHFFANLATNPIKVNDELRVFGFGGTYEDLNYANFKVTNKKTEEDSVYADMIANGGNTTGGDSGGAWLDKNNAIVATHKGSKSFAFDSEPRQTYSTNLHYSKQFILDTVDGWHYPTLANTSNGTATITVQSLHVNPTVDMAYTSGDATITGGTCTTMSSVSAFKTCTYEIESQGGTGALHLTDNETISINKPTPTAETSGGGKEGGSVSIFALLGLFGLGIVRRKVTL